MPLTLKLLSDKTEYLPGESIPIQMILKNESDTSLSIPDFTYNSDLTEIIIRDSSGNEIDRLNDFTRQKLLGFFTLETITPPEYILSPGLEVNAAFDVSQFIRLTESGKYQLAGSFRYEDNEVISEPLDISILSGGASGLTHVWQYQMAAKGHCHWVYRDHGKLMHAQGYRKNPEVIDYNLPVKDVPDIDRIFFARSCYDKDDFLPRFAGVRGNELFAAELSVDTLVDPVTDFKLEGYLAEKGMVETYRKSLIIPEVLEEQHKIRFNMFNLDGKFTGKKEIEVGNGIRIFDAAVYKSGEFLLIYSESTDKGADIYAAVSGKSDLSEIEQRKLLSSSKIFESALIPPRVKMPAEILALSFEAHEKALMIYTISLNPDIRTTPPPKQILKSQGELALQSWAIEPNNAAYLLFIEDGKKLLYYNYADSTFHFITEKKFSDSQLIVTESDGVFLAYVDHEGVVRFRQVETVVKGY